MKLSKVYVIYSLPTIIKELCEAEKRGQKEYEFTLIEINQDAFYNLQTLFKEEAQNTYLSPDVSCFIHVSEFHKLLNLVRGKIVEFLDAVEGNQAA